MTACYPNLIACPIQKSHHNCTGRPRDALAVTPALFYGFASPERSTSDDCAEGNRHAVTCCLESTNDRFTGGDRAREG
jgi:hypothetical protein